MNHMAFDGIKNIRDLGGIPAADGRHIKSGKLIRSGRLFQASADDLNRIAQMVDTVVDFRTDREVEEKPNPVIPGVAYHQIPVFEMLTAGITREAETEETLMKKLVQNAENARQYMCSMYENFVAKEHSVEAYREFLQLLMKEHERAVLWHCSVGKDRAGVAALILLEILGADREIILEDYLKTNEFAETEIARITEYVMQKMREQMQQHSGEPAQQKADTGTLQQTEMADLQTAKARAAKDQAAKEQATKAQTAKEQAAKMQQEIARSVRYLFGAHKEYVDALYAKAEEIYGSFEGFIRDGLRISDEEKADFQRHYLE